MSRTLVVAAGLVLAEIDLDDVAEARTRMPFPRDRRPEPYRDLTQP
jgi:hypothetical protein